MIKPNKLPIYKWHSYQVKEMITRIKETFLNRLTENKWMSEETLEDAKKKVLVLYLHYRSWCFELHVGKKIIPGEEIWSDWLTVPSMAWILVY